MLPDMVSKKTNDMKHRFEYNIPELDKFGSFNVDYRLTADPLIHNNVMDLDFFFDIGPENNHCLMKHETFDYKFEHFDANYMQFVLSDRIPNCFLDAMERQDFFDFKINSEWMYTKLGTNKFPITTSLFSDAFPMLLTKYGGDQKIDLELKFVRPRVIFGPETGENVHFSTTVRYGLKEHGSMNYIIYDSLELSTTFDMEISEEILLANFNTMTVSKAGEPHERSIPIYSDEGFSE